RPPLGWALVKTYQCCAHQSQGFSRMACVKTSDARIRARIAFPAVFTFLRFPVSLSRERKTPAGWGAERAPWCGRGTTTLLAALRGEPATAHRAAYPRGAGRV